MEENQKELHAQFEEHCATYLDADNIVNHIDGAKGILVDFEFFHTVVKTVFFWKKIRA